MESDGAGSHFRSTQIRIAARSLAGWICALASLFGGAGCKRNQPSRLSPARIHAITQELAQAAADAAPKGSLVKSRLPRNRSGAATAEEIYVGVHPGVAKLNSVRQQLTAVATRHGLSVEPELSRVDKVRLVLRWHGMLTHRIEIEELAAPVERASASAQPRLAILLDDLGSDRSAADAIFALHAPLTLSVLPFHPHSQEIAGEARRHGCEVMLHLPMQSLANEAPEQRDLRPGLSAQEVRNLVQEMLDAVPEADGVNNHQGSQATADSSLMTELMHVLKDEGVFYVDSRTTTATVAFDAAQREGVPAAFRNVPFLDDVQNKDAVKKQLQLAFQGAKQKGQAIAIGHPHSATLAALREMLPQAKNQGVKLVTVSELVH